MNKLDLNGLNDRQREACVCTEGPLLLLAGAGSGKTRVITHRIAYLLSEKGVDPYNILAITFTNKASREMRERVDSLIGEGAEKVWVSTFHSMCVRILRRFYDRIGGSNSFTIYDTNDQKSVIKQAMKDLDIDPKKFPDKVFLSAISKAKEEYLKPEDLEKMAGPSRLDQYKAQVYREYEKHLRLNNALDFDDLIFKTIELFVQCPDVLEIYQDRFRYIMIDEYQDTNHTQFLLVSMLAKKYKNLCVVGDDDQSIYKFRGADITNILNFENEYENARLIRLEQNYRSTKTILNAANGVIHNNKGRKEKTLWSDNDQGDEISYTLYESDFAEADGVIRAINSYARSGHPYSDIAVLYRTNNQSRSFEEKLLMSSIPYKIYGATGFYNRKEIMDIISYLKVISNPDDDVALRRIINVPKRGIGDSSVDKLLEIANDAEISLYDVCIMPELRGMALRNTEKVEKFADLMEEFRTLAGEGSLLDLFDAVLSKTGYKTELQAEGTDEAKNRIENLEELRSKISDYIEKAEDEPTLEGLLEDVALVADADKNDDENNAVSLMTLHSSKGLEFPLVFMVGMEDGLFPSNMSIESGDESDLEEERRLCYVGITRAKEKLYLTGAQSRMINGTRSYTKQSRFVQEIPSELLRYEGAAASFARDIGLFGAGKKSIGSGSYNSPSKSYTSNTASKNYYSSYSAKVGGRSLDSIPGLKKGLSTSGKAGYDYKVGDTVKHIKFGKGVVTEMTSHGDDYEVTVNFDSAGEKKLFASLAKLKKI